MSGSSYFKVSNLLLAVPLLFSCASFAKDPTKYSLMLAGGGLNVCSSMYAKACTQSRFNLDDKSEDLFLLSKLNIQALQQTSLFKEQLAETKSEISKALEQAYMDAANTEVTLTALRQIFDQKLKKTSYLNSLPEDLYWAIVNNLEVNQLDSRGLRKRERVSIADTADKDVVAIYQKFVEQAQLRSSTKKVKIAVVTASARDPFAIADYYVSIFSQLGAEVVWLPLDKSYRQARELQRKGYSACQRISVIQQGNMQFKRSQIYPELVKQQKRFCQNPKLMNKEITSLDAIFFNGGDQSLTVAALKYSDGTDSEELRLIKERVAEGNLIVGGTSAGTMVHSGGMYLNRPVPMLTNGSSKLAIERGGFAVQAPAQHCQQDCNNGLKPNDMTFTASGGSGLFDLGVLDTHFSERDREARLASIVAASGQRFGFGIDEVTALMVASDQQHSLLEVIGKAGVAVFDMDKGSYSTKRSKNGSLKTRVSGSMHYMTLADRAIYDVKSGQLAISFNEPKQVGDLSSSIKENSGFWRKTLFDFCGKNELLNWSKFGAAFEVDLANTQYVNKAGVCSYKDALFRIYN